ncbi:hypothetical protein KUCAC02_000178 [Chaenocephalus aceratus]|uniref:Uncharacterized protein n=1 Tax=Chaenocephalus aceratus TaxID=36190 RepID=A0ACB9W5M8_CHAAC|nr:hypothetical protein KUCAC02_000178 [Chaenocephalus aceratus]
MSRAGSSLSAKMSDIAVDDIRPLFVNFCKRMSVEQWDLLDQGSSDDAVKMIVAELILKCVNLVTEALLAIFNVTKTGISEENVRSCVGNILPQTFTDVLDVKVPDDCESAESLTEMIVQEVMESANSVLNASVYNSENVYRRVTPPNRLGVMVRHACDMLKAFLAKMKGVFRLPERTESQEALIELMDLFSPELQLLGLFSPELQLLDLFGPELQLLGLFSPELQLLGLFSPELQLLDLFSPELQLDLFSPELQLLDLFSPELQLDLFSPELQLLDLFSPELQLDLFSPELQLLNLFSPKL